MRQIRSALDHHLVYLISYFGSSAMHPSFVRLSSVSARASTIGFIGLGRMGYEMALNIFSKTMINHSSQHQASESTLGSSSNALPGFAVCDVNEDAAKDIVRVMRERFPGVNIAIQRTPAECVHLVYFFLQVSKLSDQHNCFSVDGYHHAPFVSPCSGKLDDKGCSSSQGLLYGRTFT